MDNLCGCAACFAHLQDQQGLIPRTSCVNRLRKRWCLAWCRQSKPIVVTLNLQHGKVSAEKHLGKFRFKAVKSSPRDLEAMERFWEGTGLLHQMRGEWFDAVSCCVTFTRGSIATRRPWGSLLGSGSNHWVFSWLTNCWKAIFSEPFLEGAGNHGEFQKILRVSHGFPVDVCIEVEKKLVISALHWCEL